MRTDHTSRLRPTRLRIFVVVIALVGVVAVAGCGSSGHPSAAGAASAGASGSGNASGAGGSASGPPPSPTVTPLSEAAYQQGLSAFDGSLGTEFQGLAAARTPTDVGNAIAAMQTTVTNETTQLQGLTPPPQAAAANGALVSALTAFGADLGNAETSAGGSQICAGSSATAMIGQSDGAAQLRTAAAQLASADPAFPLHVGSFVPPNTPYADRSLENGTKISARDLGGDGQLTIDNSAGNTDATVSLLAQGNTRPSVVAYVRASDTYTLNGISDGTYDMYVASGTDWDSTLNQFTRNCAFDKFDSPASYTTTSDATGTQYTTYSITLQPTIDGNATTSGVDPNSFPIP